MRLNTLLKVRPATIGRLKNPRPADTKAFPGLPTRYSIRAALSHASAISQRFTSTCSDNRKNPSTARSATSGSVCSNKLQSR